MPVDSAAQMLPDASLPLKSAKHEAVLQAYIADPNRLRAKAYLVVYPKSSEDAAATGFSRLLRNAGFAARLKFLDAGVTQAAVEQSGITVAATVAELAKIGFCNAKDYLRVLPGGEPAVDLSAATEDQFAALAEVTVEDFVDGRGDDARDVRRVKFRLHNKQAALVSILDHLGGFPARKHEIAGKDGGTIEVEDKTERSDLDVARRIAFLLASAARKTIAGGAPLPEPAKPKPEESDG